MGLSSAYRQTARKIIPITMQVAIRAGCSDVRDKIGNITGFARNCDLNVSPAELKEVAAALRSDPAVLADLRYQYRFAVSATLNLGRVEKSLDEALPRSALRQPRRKRRPHDSLAPTTCASIRAGSRRH